MKILFRKISEYDLKKDKRNSYIFACKILLQEINPNPIKNKCVVPKTKVIFSSKLKRAQGCIKIKNDQKVILTKSLNEIPFNLGKYCNKLEYEKEGSKAVRKIFKKLFIEDKLKISREIIFYEIKKLLISIEKEYNFEKSITIISHSFRLKCIEAYLKTNGEITNSPQLINKYIKNNSKTFDFGKGFDFEI